MPRNSGKGAIGSQSGNAARAAGSGSPACAEKADGCAVYGGVKEEYMFEQFMSAMPLKMEQRLTEEEELARALKREAAIFFPDRRLPDIPESEKTSAPLPDKGRGGTVSHSGEGRSLGRLGEGESDYETGNISYSKAGGRLGEGESDYEDASSAAESAKRTNLASAPARKVSRSGKWAEGIRMAAVLDRPRAIKPWGEEGF